MAEKKETKSKEQIEKEGKALFEKDLEIHKATSGEWPKYKMAWWPIEGDKPKKNRKFYTFSGAAQLYDSGFVQVDFETEVLYEDGTIRRMTDHDQRQISNAADEYSASK